MEQKKIYSCVIVDDNKLDALALVSHLRKYPFLQIGGMYTSPEVALAGIQPTHRPDVLFLDIDMPNMSGLVLRQHLEKIPACIFVTAHPEFALESFESDVLDFLVKPLNADRFDSAMQRLEHFLEIHSKAELLDSTFSNNGLFIKVGHDRVKLDFSEIIYLEALRDYTCIVTLKRKYHVLRPLGSLLTEKEFLPLVRIHRKYAVQKRYVRSVTPHTVMINELSLPIGRSYKDTAKQLLTIDNSDTTNGL